MQIGSGTTNRLNATDKTDKANFEALDEHLSTKKPMEQTKTMHFNETDETGEMDIDAIDADIEETNSNLLSTNPAQDELAGFNLPE